MTDEEMDRAIADFCGWEDCVNGFGTETRYKGTSSEVRVTVPYPRFSSDLNAMHEAEKAAFKSSTLWVEFAANLLNVLRASEMSVSDGMVCVLQATAAQRAEAFLRTIGKYHATHPLP